MQGYTPLSKIRLNPANPRIIRDEKYRKLVRSVAQFPKMLDLRGIVIDAGKMILGGNQRFRAIADILKMPEPELLEILEGRTAEFALWEILREKKAVPENWIVDGSDMTDDEIRRFIIADNVEFGEHDFDALANGWDADELEGWGVDVPDFAGGKQEAQEDDYEMPDEIETDIQPGDLFEIGPHRLLCGDSTKAEDVARLMDGARADMVFTDPDFSMPFPLLKNVYDVSKDHSSGFGFWVCGDKQCVQLTMNDFENFAKFFVQDFRNATLVSNNQPMTRHVMICQFGKRPMNNLHDGFSTLLQIATDRTSETHKVTPMAKKVELPFEFIAHYSNENDLVLDFFAHSGSTMVAAHQLSRRCYCMEIEPKYCQAVINRMLNSFPDIKIRKNGKDYLHNPLEANNLQPSLI